MNKTKILRSALMGALVSGLGLSLIACGNTASSVENETEGSQAIVEEATERLNQYYANNTDEINLDPVSDAGALEGKTLMYIAAGLSSASGTQGLEAIKEVQQVLGFELITHDGQFNPTEQQEGLRQAVARDVDIVMTYAVDCPGNEAAYREVRAAGIPIIGNQTIDCNEIDPEAESMLDAQPLYPLHDGSGTTADTWQANGGVQADYLISKLDGDVKVIQLDVPDFAVTAKLGEGFRERMKQCDTCEIVETVSVAVSDFGPSLQQEIEQVLLQHPEANAVQIPYDDLVSVGVSAALSSSGRADDLLVVSGTGYEASLDMIRADQGLDAGWGQSYYWHHYAALDTALRLLGGDDPNVINGNPLTVYDSENNMPDSGPFEPGIDYRSMFQTAWGQ